MELAPKDEQKFEGEEELEALEKVIATGFTSYIDVGKALKEIKEKKLYSINYKNFDEYCQDRWEFSKSYGNNLVASAKVIQNLEDNNCCQMPFNEAQVRPLTNTKLTPEKQVEAWLKAVETAPNGKITAAHVEKVVQEMIGKVKPEVSPVEPIIQEHGVALASVAISALEKIPVDDPEREKALQMVQDWLDQHRAELRAAA